MKIYTEEELRKHLYNHDERFFEELTPIELPSDEEIEHKSIDISSITSNYARKVSKSYYKAGAKWMKEQILNQSK
jgi:hypothetical protein